MMKCTLSLVRSAALILAMIFGFVLLSAATARASDIGDCLKGAANSAISAADLKGVEDFLKNPENAACVADIEDPIFIALVGVLVGLKAQGEISSVGDCQGKAAEIIVAVANKLGVSLGDAVQQGASALENTDLGKTVMDYMDCGCAIAVTGEEGLAQTLQNLASMAMSCGAVLGDIGGDIAKGVEALVSFVESLGSFIINGLEGIWDDSFGSGDDLPDTSPPPPADNACKWPQSRICYCPTQYVGNNIYQQPQDSDWRPDLQDSWPLTEGVCVNRVTHAQFVTYGCYPAFDPNNYSCGPGSQCASSSAFVNWYNSNPMVSAPINSLNPLSFLVCAPCSAVQNGVASGDGTCTCGNGYKPLYETGVSGKQTLVKCACPAPMTEAARFGGQTSCSCPILGQIPRMSGGNMVCACPDNMQLEGNLCTYCDSTKVYDRTTFACVPCPLGEQPDPENRNRCINMCKAGAILGDHGCKKCPKNTYARYLSGSIGSCEPCPPGSTSGAGSTACLAPFLPPTGGGSSGVTPTPTPQSRHKPKTPVAPPTIVVPPPMGRHIVCPPGMAPGPFGMRCFPIRPGVGRAAPQPVAPMRGIVCPPGTVPGPLGMHCFPLRR